MVENKVIESNFENKSEQVSYLTLKNPTESDCLVSVWLNGELIKLIMVYGKSEKQILLGNICEEDEIVIREQK